MFGIEIEEFPARIAEVALWLIDHIMNVELASAFGAYFVRLPLTNGPTIRIGDALEVDWRTDVLNQDPDAEWFILGNPPFIGSKMMTESQRSRIKQLFGGVTGSGVMDFVTGWYVKAAQAIQGTAIRCAFVSTNSISQGEQVGILWKHLVQKYGIHIHFAHRTFRWSNEAKGVAAVHCVIVGYGCMRIPDPALFDYATPTGDAVKVVVQSINGYLTEGEHIFITSRSTPLCNVPEMMKGDQPTDDGNLLLTKEERDNILRQSPNIARFIKRCIGAQEFLNGGDRFCLWLVDATPADIRSSPELLRRVEAVRQFRLASTSSDTWRHAERPHLFRETRHPDHDHLIVPSTTSENRAYIPIGFVTKDVVTTNLNLMIPDGTRYHFGVLMSSMHMSWVRAICGRLESRYRYSKDVVYNNYPWPETTPEQRKTIEELAQNVLDARAHHSTSSLADLYHPTTMPMDLRNAHELLDKAVDTCYRKEPFKSERERVEHLFGMYRALTEGFASIQQRPKHRPRTRKT